MPGPGTPQQDLSGIYVSDDLFEQEICGTLFKWKEIPGMDVIKASGTAETVEDLDKADYATRLINMTVVEPKNLVVSRLKPIALTQLIRAIEGSLGLNEVVRKNSTKKWRRSTSSISSPTNLAKESVKLEDGPSVQS